MHKFKMFIKNTSGFLRCLFAGVHYPGNVYIGRHVHFVNGKRIELGRNVQIRPDVDLFAGNVFKIGDGCDIGTRNRFTGDIIIEDHVLFGPGNYVSSEDHIYDDVSIPIMYQGSRSVRKNGHKEMRIGSGTCVGTHVAIIGALHIGRNCAIGANSVVTQDVPDYCVVAGIPARVIKRFNQQTNCWEKV